MKHSLKDYNATSRLKAAAIAAASALHNGVPEFIYKVALLCESNTLHPDEGAVNDLANAAADWLAAEITFLRMINGVTDDCPPNGPAFAECTSVVVRGFNPAEMKPLQPFIVARADAARDFVATLQAVIGNAFATRKDYVRALKKVSKAQAVAESFKAARAQHDNGAMDKLNKEFAEAALCYTDAVISLAASILFVEKAV